MKENKVQIFLLRGINVGRHRKIPMTELRELLINSGFKNVKTYIQSGNVILQSNRNSEIIKSQIEQKLLKHFGFEVIVLVKSKSQFQNIYSNCPFSNTEKEKSYFIMLDDKPNEVGLKEVEQLQIEGEKFEITKNCIYFFSANGYGRTKFNSNFFERKLKVNATARNNKTMLKLLAMAEEMESNL